jgi:hypothetical protein
MEKVFFMNSLRVAKKMASSNIVVNKIVCITDVFFWSVG